MSAQRLNVARVAETLAEIARDDRSSLLDRWRKVHGAPPPKSLSIGFLRQALSFEVQAAAAPRPSAQVLRDLKRQAQPATTAPSPGLKPGDQLLRDWNGHTYRVVVVEGGYEMDGQRWTSLSALAKHITGAHWSGPRFFGLNAKRAA